MRIEADNSGSTWLNWLAVTVLGIASLWINSPSYSPNDEIRAAGFETFALAESIVKHHSFADPFLASPTGPSAHLSPLYPAYVATIVRFLGHGPTAVGVLLWSMTVMLAAQQMLLPFLAKCLGLGFSTGVLASCAWLAAGMPATFVAENTFAGLLAVLVAFAMGIAFTQETSTISLLFSGVLWGLLLLAQPTVALVFGGWLLLLHFKSHRSNRQKIVLALLPLLVVSPWIVRNYVVFHRVVFIRDNLGKELAESNSPCASALWVVNNSNGCFASVDPNVNRDEALKLRSMGEVEYNRIRMGDAINSIRANPRSFLALSAERLSDFWFPPLSQGQAEGELDQPWVLHSFTLLSIAGIVVMWMRIRTAAYVFGLWLALFPLAYYFIQFLPRYRWSIVWATFLPGSYFIVDLVKGRLTPRRSKASPLRTRGRKRRGKLHEQKNPTKRPVDVPARYL